MLVCKCLIHAMTNAKVSALLRCKIVTNIFSRHKYWRLVNLRITITDAHLIVIDVIFFLQCSSLVTIVLTLIHSIFVKWDAVFFCLEKLMKKKKCQNSKMLSKYYAKSTNVHQVTYLSTLIQWPNMKVFEQIHLGQNLKKGS